MFQINQTWKTLPPAVLVCTAKPQAKKLKNRNKEQLHLHLKIRVSDKGQQGAHEVSAQTPEESALPGTMSTPVSPDFTSRV